ncbi:MAG: serine/threonine-protein kinase [Myxococcota bacterium]|nr:serine/threonine-protein kinase [Myxococcota bacterium]
MHQGGRNGHREEKQNVVMDPAQTSLIGTVFDDKFEVLGEIARGGMGVVYRGTDKSLGRSVAIKVLQQQFNTDSESVARFRREARAMAALDHPNIVPVFAIGHEFELHYFVMKFLAGWTVSERLKRIRLGLSEPFTPDECRTTLIQLCRGLEHAHRRSLIHRDIKPSNIMIAPDGHVTIMDFGIVKEASDDTLTKTGIVFGTPDYMAPEHAQGKPPSPATDLYSLGIVAYEMLTGQQPFTGSTPFSLVLKHIKEPPPPLIERCPDVNPEFQDIIFRAIEKDPADRYASAGDMMNALQGLDLTSSDVDEQSAPPKPPSPQPPKPPQPIEFSQPRTSLPPAPIVERSSVPRQRPSIYDSQSSRSPLAPRSDSSLQGTPLIGPMSAGDSDEPSRAVTLTDRPGHYQRLVTSMEPNRHARKRRSTLKIAATVVVLSVVVAAVVFML